MSFDWQLYGKKPNTVFGYIGWLYYTYCIVTGLYMLDSWERNLFRWLAIIGACVCVFLFLKSFQSLHCQARQLHFPDAILIIVLSMSIYTGYIFLPQHIMAMLTHFGIIAGHGTASS